MKDVIFGIFSKHCHELEICPWMVYYGHLFWYLRENNDTIYPEYKCLSWNPLVKITISYYSKTNLHGLENLFK